MGTSFESLQVLMNQLALVTRVMSACAAKTQTRTGAHPGASLGVLAHEYLPLMTRENS